MSQELTGRAKRKADLAQRKHELKVQILDFLEAKIKEGMSGKDALLATDRRINEMARAVPTRKSEVLAAALELRTELRAKLNVGEKETPTTCS